MDIRLQSTAPTTGPRAAERAALGLSAGALLLSLVATGLWLDADRRADFLEDRLTCLELPGPNDCGLDGR